MAQCGLDAETCIMEHWCLPLDARRERAGWRAPCPVCGSPRGLSLQVKGRYPAWNTFCECERDDVRATLAERVPGCVSARYRGRHRIEPQDVIDLALADMPPQSLRVGLLELAGWPTSKALDALSVTRTNRYRVVSALRQNRRSLGVSVSIHPKCLRFDTSPQIRQLLTRG